MQNKFKSKQTKPVQNKTDANQSTGPPGGGGRISCPSPAPVSHAGGSYLEAPHTPGYVDFGPGPKWTPGPSVRQDGARPKWSPGPSGPGPTGTIFLSKGLRPLPPAPYLGLVASYWLLFAGGCSGWLTGRLAGW